MYDAGSRKGKRHSREKGESMRDWILRRDAYRCVYCGEIFAPEDLTLDHVEPRMRGGDHSEGNLVAACRGCNLNKGSLPAWAFLAERPVERENFLRYGDFVWSRLKRAVREAASKRSRR